jgi:hypothetical protein
LVSLPNLLHCFDSTKWNQQVQSASSSYASRWACQWPQSAKSSPTDSAPCHHAWVAPVFHGIPKILVRKINIHNYIVYIYTPVSNWTRSPQETALAASVAPFAAAACPPTRVLHPNLAVAVAWAAAHLCILKSWRRCGLRCCPAASSRQADEQRIPDSSVCLSLGRQPGVQDPCTR